MNVIHWCSMSNFEAASAPCSMYVKISGIFSHLTISTSPRFAEKCLGNRHSMLGMGHCGFVPLVLPSTSCSMVWYLKNTWHHRPLRRCHNGVEPCSTANSASGRSGNILLPILTTCASRHGIMGSCDEFVIFSNVIQFYHQFSILWFVSWWPVHCCSLDMSWSFLGVQPFRSTWHEAAT